MNRTNLGAENNVYQIIFDIVIVVFSYLVDCCIFLNFVGSHEFFAMTALIAVFSIVFIVTNKEQRLYNTTLFYYLDRMHKKLMKSFLLAFFTVIILLYFVVETNKGQNFFFMFLIVEYVCISLKMFFYKPIMRWHTGKNVPRTAFVGRKGSFNKFKYFLEKTSIHMQEVGYIAMDKNELEKSKDGEYIGSIEDLEDIIREYHIDQVYIIQKDGNELPFTQKYVDLCIEMGVTVRLIVDFYKKRRANSYVSSVGTYPVITYHTITLNTGEQLLKRVLDVLFATMGVIVASPIMLVTAIAIKLDSKGPIFFKQTRVGQNGRHFKIYKFRSMYIDAEERKKELMEKNEIEGGVMFKMKDDPRITRVGKFIRKTSIDELPQFFNVIGGSMSLVGTRPPTLDEVDKYETKQWKRISIKPGITGMWQVNGRSRVTSFDDIVELDVEYIDNWTLWLDIKILMKTVLVLLKHDGAY